MFLWLISNLKRQIDKSIVVLAAFLEQAKPSRKRCLGRLDVKDNKILVVDDVCECGSPVEWFRPYPGKVNAVRSVWLWLCDRCGRIYGQDISVMMDWYISMKSKTEYLTFNTTTRRAFVNITPDVRKIIEASGIKEGLCLVNAMHITASVFINDNESGLHDDFEKWLESLAPHAPTERYRHNETGEDNADAHLKRQVMGRETIVAITNGKLDFGPWEQIFYGEFDGRRNKRVLVKVIGE